MCKGNLRKSPTIITKRERRVHNVENPEFLFNKYFDQNKIESFNLPTKCKLDKIKKLDEIEQFEKLDKIEKWTKLKNRQNR